jgi:hypothetical protein
LPVNTTTSHFAVVAINLLNGFPDEAGLKLWGVKKIELWQIAIYDNENGYPYDAVCKMSQHI